MSQNRAMSRGNPYQIVPLLTDQILKAVWVPACING